MKIRKYLTITDYDEIKSWWWAYGLDAPTPEMMPEESTFVCEDKNKRLIGSITVYLTNSKALAIAEHLIRNPAYQEKDKSQMTDLFSEHILGFVRGLGYKSLTVLIEPDGLFLRYLKLGYKKVSDVRVINLKT